MTEFSDRLPRPRRTVRISPVSEHTTITAVQRTEHIWDAVIRIDTTEGPYEIVLWQDGEVARRIARAIAPGSVREEGE